MCDSIATKQTGAPEESLALLENADAQPQVHSQNIKRGV